MRGVGVSVSSAVAAFGRMATDSGAAAIAQSRMDDWLLRLDHGAAVLESAPDDEPLEICWRVSTPSQDIVVCGMYQNAAPGIALRAVCKHGLILGTRRISTTEEARLTAAEWLDAIRSMTGFEEVME